MVGTLCKKRGSDVLICDWPYVTSTPSVAALRWIPASTDMAYLVVPVYRFTRRCVLFAASPSTAMLLGSCVLSCDKGLGSPVLVAGGWSSEASMPRMGRPASPAAFSSSTTDAAAASHARDRWPRLSTTPRLMRDHGLSRGTSNWPAKAIIRQL